MSLYNDTAARIAQEAGAQGVGGLLSSKGAMGAASSMVGGAASAAGAQFASMVGGGKVATVAGKTGANIATSAVMNAVGKHIPPTMQRSLDVGSRAAGDVLQRDRDGAGMRVMDSGLLESHFPGVTGIAAQERFWGRSTPMLGGLSPGDARKLFDEVMGAGHARKNLWLIEVSSGLSGAIGAARFNLFATDVDYSPFTLVGEKRRVGSSYVDAVQSGEPVDLRITAYDDQAGTLKKWFAMHHLAASPVDGTVGVPGGAGGYAITIKVVHAFASRPSSSEGAYEDMGYFRTANIEMSLSRREDGLQEIQMTFSQIDTFMVPA